ncbi:unnamed protein product [Closterium sp. NIES-54]
MRRLPWAVHAGFLSSSSFSSSSAAAAAAPAAAADRAETVRKAVRAALDGAGAASSAGNARCGRASSAGVLTTTLKEKEGSDRKEWQALKERGLVPCASLSRIFCCHCPTTETGHASGGHGGQEEQGELEGAWWNKILDERDCRKRDWRVRGHEPHASICASSSRSRSRGATVTGAGAGAGAAGDTAASAGNTLAFLLVNNWA